jgi:ABC-type phosphate/phosphonate transport system permease subunit
MRIMNAMGNATGDLMANWMTSGGVLLAQDANVTDNIDQGLSAAASTQGASCGWIDPEISAAQGSHQFRCAVS